MSFTIAVIIVIPIVSVIRHWVSVTHSSILVIPHFINAVHEFTTILKHLLYKF